MEPYKRELDHEWVINLSRALQEEDNLEDNEEDDQHACTVTVFEVPKTLLISKPEAYTPHIISLGPYHHRRLELFHMERYKLSSAKRVQKNLKNELKFDDLVNQIAQFDLRARAFYHRYFDFDRERLAWLFTIDASFLLEYLHTYAISSSWEGSLGRVSMKMGHLIDRTRRKATHQAILRDIIMLENQIPLFLVREVYTFYQPKNQKLESTTPASQTYSQLQGAIPHHAGSTSPASQNEFAEQELLVLREHDEIWVKMLMGFCKHLAPIKYFDNRRFREECFTKAHLLELLYCTVTTNLPFDQFDQQEKPKEEANETGKITVFRKVLGSIFQFIFFIIFAPIHLLFRICRSEIAMLLITLPWKIIVSIFKLRGKSALNNIISATGNVLEVAENDASHAKDDGPLVEEIAIPSVTELSEIGVKFNPTKGGISTIKFDKSSGVFHLPVVHLNDNSDVVIRNLVAYEACIGPEAMVFTRYTELMNGIIDTEGDARVLREAGILVNRLKSDKEVASLWNGMTKSVRVTKVPKLDKAIEAANGYYSESWKVKTRGVMKKYVYGSWPALTFIAANVLILLSIVETFCSVYKCSKWLDALQVSVSE